MKNDSTAKTFRFRKQIVDLIDDLTKQYDCSATAIIETAITVFHANTTRGEAVSSMVAVSQKSDTPEGESYVHGGARGGIDTGNRVGASGNMAGNAPVVPRTVQPAATPSEKPKDMTWAEWGMIQRKNNPPPVPPWRQGVQSLDKVGKK